MTIHTFEVGNDEKRDYMLEVNPKYTDPSYKDTLNVIDARWIDIETGLFIDITAVRPHQSKKGIICSKDQHEEKVCLILTFRHSAPRPPHKPLTNPTDPRPLPPPRLPLRKPTGEDSLQLRPPAHARVRQCRPHEDGIFGPPLQHDKYGMGAIQVSELPREGCLPGFAGFAARWEETEAQVRWLTRRQGPS